MIDKAVHFKQPLAGSLVYAFSGAPVIEPNDRSCSISAPSLCLPERLPEARGLTDGALDSGHSVGVLCVGFSFGTLLRVRSSGLRCPKVNAEMVEMRIFRELDWLIDVLVRVRLPRSIASC